MLEITISSIGWSPASFTLKSVLGKAYNTNDNRRICPLVVTDSDYSTFSFGKRMEQERGTLTSVHGRPYKYKHQWENQYIGHDTWQFYIYIGNSRRRTREGDTNKRTWETI